MTPVLMTPDRLTGRPEQLAVTLLGCLLEVVGDGAGMHAVVQARIVEVEAYGGVAEDPASHAHRGVTRRNATMFAPVGRLYVYFTYGMHWCANVVVHPDGVAGAVLVRAAVITTGLEVVRSRRGHDVPERDLARGPARLTKSLDISGADDGVDLLTTGSRVRLRPGTMPGQVSTGRRVGVAGDGADTPWRWWDTASPAVSAYRPAARRRSDTRRGPP